MNETRLFRVFSGRFGVRGSAARMRTGMVLGRWMPPLRNGEPGNYCDVTIRFASDAGFDVCATNAPIRSRSI